jgi:hypothetical protein
MREADLLLKFLASEQTAPVLRASGLEGVLK